MFLFQIGDALKIDEKNPNALSMLGSLELQSDETWLTAKEHFRDAKEATTGDTYSLLQLVHKLISLKLICSHRERGFTAISVK